MIERSPALVVAFDTSTPREALELARTIPVDLVISDLVLPDMSGVAYTLAMRRLQPGCKVLGLSMLEDPLRIAELLRAGAAGFVHKGQPPETILEAVHLVLGGMRYLPPSISRHEIDALVGDPEAWPLERLTQREREVFLLLADGCSNDEIATRLFIARRTVEAHRYNVMHKVGARSVVDLVRMAVRHGL